MAFELLGPSLLDLFAYCEYQFSLKTTLMIADQVLERLETFHTEGLLHRDLKPQNLLLGCGTQGNVVYLVDFGIADEYTTQHELVDEKVPVRLRLVGTARFASIRGHRGLRMSKPALHSLHG
jgi:serine/threonine protein kinase